MSDDDKDNKLSPKQMEKLISELVKLEQFKDEDRATYLGRLVRAVNKVEEQDWTALPKQAQTWYNKAADAHTSGAPIIDFDGKPVKEVASSTADTDGEQKEDKVAKNGKDDEEKPTKKQKSAAKEEDESEKKLSSKKSAKKGKKDAKPDKKPAKKSKDEEEDDKPEKKAKKNGKGKTPKEGLIPGIKTELKLILASDINMDGKKYMAAIKAKKIDASMATVRAVRAEFRHTCRVLEHLKLLRKPSA